MNMVVSSETFSLKRLKKTENTTETPHKKKFLQYKDLNRNSWTDVTFYLLGLILKLITYI